MDELLIKWQKSPIEFIGDIWGLKPQKLKEGVRDDLDAKDYSEDDFEPFVMGSNITWQQWLIMRAVEKSIKGEAPPRISVASGHGTGKSSSMALIILWYITCHPEAIIPCTAPTASQLHDVLWKEIALWIVKMPKEFKGLYYQTSDYLRVRESPKTWFARARTASKETPEALAGLHAEYMLFAIDEASAVPDEVFEVAEGALTSPNTLVIMISNYTRVRGYFHNSQTGDKESWQCLSLNSEQSPIVNKNYKTRIETLYGKDSDEYRVRVLGLSPKLETRDADGWMRLIEQSTLTEIEPEDFIGPTRLGVDPSGSGEDETVWVLRDNFQAAVVGYEKKSTDESIAQKTVMLMEAFDIDPMNIYIDNFGTGANVAQKLALMGFNVNAINVGNKTNYKGFANLRAIAFWSLKMWLRGGRALVKNGRWGQLLDIMYRRKENNDIQIMPKLVMAKRKIKSPNAADALMLTFVESTDIDSDKFIRERDILETEEPLYPDVNV